MPIPDAAARAKGAKKAGFPPTSMSAVIRGALMRGGPTMQPGRSWPTAALMSTPEMLVADCQRDQDEQMPPETESIKSLQLLLISLHVSTAIFCVPGHLKRLEVTGTAESNSG